MTTPIFSFIASGSDHGKTWLVERLVGEFSRRGLRVCAVKHAAHLDLPDVPGKDSERFARSGAGRTIAFSDHALLLTESAAPSAEHLTVLAGDGMDIVLVEGYKKGPFPKVEVFNPGCGDAPLCAREGCADIIALVSPESCPVDLPRFSFDDISGLCDFLLRWPGC